MVAAGRNAVHKKQTLMAIAAFLMLSSVVAGRTEQSDKSESAQDQHNVDAFETPPSLQFDQKQAPSDPATYARWRDPRLVAYASDLNYRLRSLLKFDGRLSNDNLYAIAKVWISADGRVTDVKVDQTMGDPALAGVLRALLRVKLTASPPPNGAPMPVIVEVGRSKRKSRFRKSD